MARLQTRLTGAVVLTLLLALVFPTEEARAQDAPTITIYGFVKAETIYDTRQVADVREGQFHLYPLPEVMGVDEEGDEIDLNDTDNWLQTVIQTRVGLRGAGTRVLGADLTGVIEGDFFGGPTNDNISLFILRHAYVQLATPTYELLFGQYWSPLFTVPVFPGTISFNTGAPFQPFARQPQIRLTYRFTPEFHVLGALAGQRDAFSEIGGPKLQQQAGLPMLHLHLRYGTGASLIGAGGYAKWIRPALATDRFMATAIQGYAKYTAETFGVAGKVTYGGDLTDHLMTGGFVSSVEDGELEFEPLQVLAAWAEVYTTGSPVQFGLYGGYLTNLGASDDFTLVDGGPSGLRAPNIDHLWRVAPRVVYTVGKFRLAGEIEVTAAAYADELGPDFAPEGDTNTVTNVRGLLAAYYLF